MGPYAIQSQGRTIGSPRLLDSCAAGGYSIFINQLHSNCHLFGNQAASMLIPDCVLIKYLKRKSSPLGFVPYLEEPRRLTCIPSFVEFWLPGVSLTQGLIRELKVSWPTSQLVNCRALNRRRMNHFGNTWNNLPARFMSVWSQQSNWEIFRSWRESQHEQVNQHPVAVMWLGKPMWMVNGFLSWKICTFGLKPLCCVWCWSRNHTSSEIWTWCMRCCTDDRWAGS